MSDVLDEVDLQIRNARLADAEILAAAQRAIARTPGRLASTPDEIHEASFRERIARLAGGDRGAFVVATCGAPREETLVGHAILDPLKLAVTAHVVDLTLAVHEGYQRRGIGRFLLSHLIAWAESSPHVYRVELRVRSVNYPAVELYKKMGFVLEGRMINRIQLSPNQYCDDLVMGLWVGPPRDVG